MLVASMFELVPNTAKKQAIDLEGFAMVPAWRSTLQGSLLYKVVAWSTPFEPISA